MKTVAQQVLAGLAGAGVGAVGAHLQHARWYVLLAVLVGFAVMVAGVLGALPWIVMRIKTSFADAEIECRRRWAESGLLPEQADRRYAGGGAAAKTSPRSELAAPPFRPPATSPDERRPRRLWP